MLPVLLRLLSRASFLVGCAARKNVSSGQNDKAAGFLFISDTRANAQNIVVAMDAKELPVHVTVGFGKVGHPFEALH